MRVQNRPERRDAGARGHENRSGSRGPQNEGPIRTFELNLTSRFPIEEPGREPSIRYQIGAQAKARAIRRRGNRISARDFVVADGRREGKELTGDKSGIPSVFNRLELEVAGAGGEFAPRSSLALMGATPFPEAMLWPDRPECRSDGMAVERRRDPDGNAESFRERSAAETGQVPLQMYTQSQKVGQDQNLRAAPAPAWPRLLRGADPLRERRSHRESSRPPWPPRAPLPARIHWPTERSNHVRRPQFL